MLHLQLWTAPKDDSYLAPLKKESIIDKINLSCNKEGDCECFMVDPFGSPHNIAVCQITPVFC